MASKYEVRGCGSCPFYFYMERGGHEGDATMGLCLHPAHKNDQDKPFGWTDGTCPCPLESGPITIARAKE